MMVNKNKKIVYLFGGSGLIGSAINKLLIKKNYKVINFDIKKGGSNFVYFNCSDLSQIKITLIENFRRFGVPDVLINCSYPTEGDWMKNDFKRLELNRVKNNLDVHLLSYTFISDIIAKKMVQKKTKGKIILFSSIYGFLAQNLNNYKGTKLKENVTYSLIKGGILSLVKQMAAYYGKKNLQINAVSPGAVIGHIKGSKEKQNKKFINNYSKNTPLGRFAKPIEIANLVNFLSSNECSYITGQNIIIDGGYSII